MREAVQRYKITARETQVLRLLLQGASTALIADALQIADTTAVTNGTTEWQMRNQFRAWSKFMTMSM